VQHYLVVAYYKGMACIVAALESYDEVGFFSEKVYDLAFSFIAPLGSDNYQISHVFPSRL
jgi:archaellum component FlaD/FlaE